jgi:hypothetical protein
VYFDKTKDVISDIRALNNAAERLASRDKQQNLINKLQNL